MLIAHPLADIDLVIFDCDGVLINSEELASGVCVEAVKELGLHLTPHQYADRYAGHPVNEIWRRVEEDCGKALPEDFGNVWIQMCAGCSRRNWLRSPVWRSCWSSCTIRAALRRRRI